MYMALFKTYTAIYFLGLYNSSFHNLIIHYTNLYCCHTTKVRYQFKFTDTTTSEFSEIK